VGGRPRPALSPSQIGCFLPGWFGEEDFFEGYSPAQETEDRWGFIDTTSRWAVSARYWRVERFSEGLAAVTFPLTKDADFPIAYIDTTGKTVIQLAPNIGQAGLFSEGLASVTEKGYTSVGKAGYIDRSGKVVVRPQFAVAGDFHNGLAHVVLDGRCFIAGDSGERAGTPPSVPAATSCGGVPNNIRTRCKEGFIDKTGKLVFEFEGARDFSEGLAPVSVSGKWGFINAEGALSIRPAFDQTLGFSEGLAAVRQGQTWGYVDKAGMITIPFQFTKAASFSDGMAKVDGGYIDRSGRRVLLNDSGTVFVGGLAHISFGPDRFGYINKAGKTVFEYSATDMNKFK